MSNDLISRKELLSNIDEVIAQYNWEDDGVIMDILTCVRDMVFDHPTAYHLDRVIEELEENYLYSVGNLKMISLDEAIEIVKKGGPK